MKSVLQLPQGVVPVLESTPWLPEIKKGRRKYNRIHQAKKIIFWKLQLLPPSPWKEKKRCLRKRALFSQRSGGGGVLKKGAGEERQDQLSNKSKNEAFFHHTETKRYVNKELQKLHHKGQLWWCWAMQKEPSNLTQRKIVTQYLGYRERWWETKSESITVRTYGFLNIFK